MSRFGEAWVLLADEVYTNAVAKGFRDDPPSPERMLILMHCELSEAVEWLRSGERARSDHIPAFTGLEEELADVVIRIMDMDRAMKLNVGAAIEAKMDFNQGRPRTHGGKRF